MDSRDPSSRLGHREALKITLGVLLPVFLGSIDQTIVGAALPTIGRDFGDLSNLPWVVTAYLLTGTAVTPVVGKLSDIHGRRITMLAAIAVFLAGSILCGLAPSLVVLILGRAVQGLGGGSLILIAMTVLGDIAAPKDRARYYTYFVVVFASAGALGPALGGLIAQYLDWTVIFWVNLPLGLLSFALSSVQLRRLPRHGRRHRLDLLGAGLVMVATAALMAAVDLGGKRFGWVSAPILGLAALSAMGWVCFAVRLRRAPEPLVPLGVLSNPVVIFAVLANATGSSSVTVLNVFVPMFLQLVVGLSASHSGLLLMTLMFSFNIGAGISGQLTARVRRYKLLPMIGVVLALAGTVALGVAVGDLRLIAVEALLTLIGLGFGTVPPVATVALQNAVEWDQLGAATASLNFARNLASTILVGVVGAILAVRLGGDVVQGGTAVALDQRAGLAEAFQLVFFGTSVGFALSLMALWRLEERPLRTGSPAVREPA
ncbi:MAG TPA: MDR family MFS transporter [Hyphomicrobiales bacterium]|nr:MDR family MFS transporter [Hyphomicrobiales bacterium]